MRDRVTALFAEHGQAAEAFRAGRRVFLFGNGGSAADAQHLAAEFVNRFLRERPALPAVALTTDTSILTCIANDRSYDDVFVRQLEALGGEGDVAMALSTSGRSPNVVRGVEVARKLGMRVVVFTGGRGGDLARRADVALVVPSESTPRIQELHMLAGHVLCDLVEAALFPDAPPVGS